LVAGSEGVIKVYSAPHALVLGNLRNALLAEGIASEVRTPFLAAARGDVPFTECWSELWVVDDQDADRALSLIRAVLEPGEQKAVSWRCQKCGEEIEGQFGACWQCGSVRSDGDA
jgi:Putative prokaryotic signal transducing protein